MYIYTPCCRNRITLYRYVTVFIVPHIDIELEGNKQFFSNIPRTLKQELSRTKAYEQPIIETVFLSMKLNVL